MLKFKFEIETKTKYSEIISKINMEFELLICEINYSSIV